MVQETARAKAPRQEQLRHTCLWMASGPLWLEAGE